MTNRLAPWGSILPMLILGSACSSAQVAAPAAKAAPAPCPAIKTVVTLGASPRVNSTAGEEGRPVQVRVYLLKNDAHLKNAKFEDVWEHDKDALAEDLVKSDQYTLFPGQSKRLTLEPPPEAHSVAAVALFREPHDRSWFVTYDLDPTTQAKEGACPKGDRAISIWLDGMQIRDGEGEDDPAPASAADGKSDADAHPSKGNQEH